jgi:hypothetical protein
LPLIENIILSSHSNTILENISKKNLPNITNVVASIDDTNILIDKCPNTHHLTLYSHNKDTSNLTALTGLLVLHVANGYYETLNLKHVLSGVGPRHRELALFSIQNLNITDIITLCPFLETLVLDSCLFEPLNQNVVIDPETSHFNHLLTLEITQMPDREFLYPHLRYCLNLQALDCTGLNVLDDDFMCDAVQGGSFRNITRLFIIETGCGVLTMRTADIVIQHCERLSVLGRLGTWRRLNPDMICDLKKRIVSRNRALLIL